MAQPHEETLEVVLAGLLDFASLDVDVVDGELLFGDQGLDVKAERGDVFRQFLGRFLEGDKDARLVELRGAVDEKLHAQQRLPGACASHDERRSSLRHPTARDLVES